MIYRAQLKNKLKRFNTKPIFLAVVENLVLISQGDRYTII